jgi:hypothetical protein
MTQLQYNIFIKQLKTFHTAQVAGHTFTIKDRVPKGIYELEDIYKGSMAILYVGEFDSCIEATVETLKLMGEIA